VVVRCRQDAPLVVSPLVPGREAVSVCSFHLQTRCNAARHSLILGTRNHIAVSTLSPSIDHASHESHRSHTLHYSSLGGTSDNKHTCPWLASRSEVECKRRGKRGSCHVMLFPHLQIDSCRARVNAEDVCRCKRRATHGTRRVKRRRMAW
jgi:hypothetical protein